MTDFVRRIAFGELEPFEVLGYIKKLMPRKEIPQFSKELKVSAIVELMPSMGDYRTLTRDQAKRLIAVADYIDSNLSILLSEPEPSTKRAKAAFKLAIERGFMEKIGDNNYKWLYNRGSHASLSYFLVKVYAPDGTVETPFRALERLFGRKQDTLAKSYDRAYNQTKNVQKWRAEIDELVSNL